MATQVLQVPLRSLPKDVPVRADVSDVFVAVLDDDGLVIDLLQRPSPGTGVLRVNRADVVVHRAVESRAGGLEPPGPISVIVPTRERPDDLKRCLESLVPVQREGHQIIVVDNSPRTRQTADVVHALGMELVTEPVRGLNRARNAGLAAAAHDILAFVDDDTVVARNWIAAIRGPFADPQVGCVTGLVLPLELETSGQEQFELYCRHRRDLQRRVYSRVTLPASAAGVVGMGANMAFRRHLLIRLGGFDPRLDAGTTTRSGGDTDVFARVLDVGASIVYTPDAHVWHRHRRQRSDVRSCVFGYGIGLYGMLTKRLVERQDLAAVVTAGRWLLGPVVKGCRNRLLGRPAAAWDIVLAETMGSFLGPFCYGYESLRQARLRREHSITRHP